MDKALLKRFMIASAFFSIIGGFGLAGHLSAVLALGFPLRPSYFALAQAHGHLQIIGFAGLLLLGVSLYFIPRLISRPGIKGAETVLYLVAGGLLLRSAAQIILPYAKWRALEVLMFTGSILESAGILLYLWLLAKSLGKSGARLVKNPATSRLMPYVLCMIIGWLTFAGLNIYGAGVAFKGDLFLVPIVTIQLTIDTFVYLILLPATFLFSFKLLPLFLGLREPSRRAIWVATSVTILSIFRYLGSFNTYHPAASILFGGAIILFIFSLDLLRTKKPERLAPLIQSDALRGRGFLPDNGEYGRFELHIWAAYGWLFIAALTEIAYPFARGFNPDTQRHIYLLGFATNLIFGVGYRMLPGIIERRLLKTNLTAMTAALVNAAALGRIMPRLIPELASTLIGKWSFAASGTLGLIAALLFWLSILKFNYSIKEGAS